MRIPLFDEILENSGIANQNDYHNFYETMFKKLLNLKAPKKEFYKDLPKYILPAQRRKLVDTLTENKEVLMWIECLTSITSNQLNGVAVVLEMKKFSCNPKNVGIIHLANKFKYSLSYFSTLKKPLTLKEVDALIAREITYFQPLIKNTVRQKMLFLYYSNAIDLNDETTDIICHFISRMHAFIPLYRGTELRKMLNRSIKNQVLNQINFYTAEKRKSMETNENDGTCFSKTISQNCEGKDGDDFNLLDKYVVEQNDFTLPLLNIECSNQIRLYENENDKVMVEILKILNNDSPSYINWYNKRFGTQYDCPVQASEDRNFLNTIAEYCKISFSYLKNYLAELKPDFVDILSAA